MILTFDYPPNDGGIARLCSIIATTLAQEKHQVSVITQQHPGANGCEQTDNDTVAVIRLCQRRPWREWEAYRYIKAFLARNRTPLLSGIWYPEGLVATLAGATPRIILAHGSELYPPVQRWRRPLWKWLQKLVLESADLVIADSDFSERLVRSVAPSAQVVAVPLCVDHHFFTPGDREAARKNWQAGNKRIVCTVARVNRYKGHETVLQALADLPSQERAQIIYLVAGNGPDLDVLKTVARDLKVASQVRWLGFVPEEELPALYSAADLFVLAARKRSEERAVEGFGLVYLEAQACATPVVGTRTGGIPSAITQNDGGWLIEQDDVAALTGVLHRLVSDPDSFVAMGQLARQRVEREFTREHYLYRFKQALRMVGIELEAGND